MDWTLQNIALKEIFDVITLGELLALLTLYFGARRRSFVLELGGVLAILYVSLPLFSAVLDLLGTLMEG